MSRLRDEMDWKETEVYLYEMKKAYEEIGWTGSFALNLTINPIVKRFESGERTKELHEEIWNIE